MNQLTKAQLTVGILACFAIAGGLIYQALQASDQIYAFGLVVLQFVAIIILSVILLGLLEWIKIFDLKTNAVLTLIVLIIIRLSIEFF